MTLYYACISTKKREERVKRAEANVQARRDNTDIIPVAQDHVR